MGNFTGTQFVIIPNCDVLSQMHNKLLKQSDSGYLGTKFKNLYYTKTDLVGALE